MGDEGDVAPVAQLGRGVEDGDRQAPREIDEPHAIAATDRKIGGPCLCLQAIEEASVALAVEIAGIEDHGASGACGNGVVELSFKANAVDAEHGKVDRLRKVHEGLVAGKTGDLPVTRIDREDVATEAGIEEAVYHPVTGTAFPLRGTNHGDGTRIEHALETMVRHVSVTPRNREGLAPPWRPAAV